MSQRPTQTQRGASRTQNGSSSSSGSGLNYTDNNVVNLADDSDDDSDAFENDKPSPEEIDAIDARRRKEFKTISVFWANRCVPNSHFTALPFFPKARTRKECADQVLPEQWRSRIKGFLFFKNSFVHISNNKLQLLFDQGIESWLQQSHTSKVSTVRYNTISVIAQVHI